MIEDSSELETFPLKLKRRLIFYFTAWHNSGEEETLSKSSRECYVKIVKTRSRLVGSLDFFSFFSTLEGVVAHESEASRRRIFKDRRWPHRVKWKFPGFASIRLSVPHDRAEMTGTKRDARPLSALTAIPEIYLLQWRHDLGRNRVLFKVFHLRADLRVSYFYRKLKCHAFIVHFLSTFGNKITIK